MMPRTRLAALALLLSAAVPAVAQDHDARVARVLKATPLIDGHNDWAEAQRNVAGDARWTLDLRQLDPAKYNTDIARLRRGKVGGQFWSVYIPASLPGPEQVKETLEQIDLVRQWVARYPETFALARTAADVRRIHAGGRIASMIGVEGGGQIDKSLSVLRTYHNLGVGYLTLTHSRTIEWADSATDTPRHGGLTPFGEAVVRELNRLGMLVDLSHVDENTMRDTLRITKAPVIFSHTSARGLVDHPRNVSDDVLRLVAANGGVVMGNFAPPYISDAYRRWSADLNAERARVGTPPFGGLYIGQPERAAAAIAEWQRTHPEPRSTLAQAADHLEHIARIAGRDHVGIGGDFDGLGDIKLPDGLPDVGSYPALLAELMRRGWTDADIAKLAGGNILRAMEAAERVAASLKGATPENAVVPTSPTATVPSGT